MSGFTQNLKDNFRFVIAIVGLLYVVHIVGLVLSLFGLQLNSFGIHPRTVHGLFGVFSHPFLHEGWSHLFSNTIVLFVVLFLALSHGRRLVLVVSIVIIVFTGLFVWVIGASGTNHIGASGWIYGLMAFLLLTAIFRRDFKSVAIALAILFLYAGQLAAVFQWRAGLSWEAHVFGFAGGLVAAYLVRPQISKPSPAS